MFAALDDLVRQCLSWNIHIVSTQHGFETMQRQAIDLLGGYAMRNRCGMSGAQKARIS
jgi:hypothetical protein